MVSFRVSDCFYEIGNSDFLYSFFSTIAYNLEDKKWGKKYPYIMNDLYSGNLAPNKINKAIKELKLIKEGLKKLPTDKVIWDFENPREMPPWGNNIADTITDLSNYFVTSDGRDLIEVLNMALSEAEKMKCSIQIEAI